LNENEAVEKMKDLEVSISTLLKYRSVRKKLPGLFMIFLLTVLGTLLISVLVNYYDYLIAYPYLGALFPDSTGTYTNVTAPVLALWIVSVYISYRMLRSSMKENKVLNWGNDLKEGVIGILKIIENQDWNRTLIDLKEAKQAFLLVSILKLILFWVIAIIAAILVLGVMGSYVLSQSIYNNYFIAVIVIVAGVIVLGLGDRSISKSYRELWYMDSLIYELRWFYIEFQGSGL